MTSIGVYWTLWTGVTSRRSWLFFPIHSPLFCNGDHVLMSWAIWCQIIRDFPIVLSTLNIPVSLVKLVLTPTMLWNRLWHRRVEANSSRSLIWFTSIACERTNSHCSISKSVYPIKGWRRMSTWCLRVLYQERLIFIYAKNSPHLHMKP